VLEHLPEPSTALREAARVTRRWCIFSVPHEPIWRVLNMARGAILAGVGQYAGAHQSLVAPGVDNLSRAALRRCQNQDTAAVADGGVPDKVTD